MSPQEPPKSARTANLMESFACLPEPRRRASCSYPLDELLLTALCAISSGADDWVEVALWGQEWCEWLREFLPFATGCWT